MIDKLREAYEAKEAEARRLYADFEAARAKALSEDVDVTDLESEAFGKMDEKHKVYAVAADEAKGLGARLERALLMEADSNGHKQESGERIAERKAEERKAELWTPADAVLESDAYKALKDSGALTTSRKSRVEMNPVEAMGVSELKNLLRGGSDADGGHLVLDDRQPGILPLLRRPFVVANLVNTGDTDSDTVEYVRIDSRDNAAAETPEATSKTDTAADAPESSVDFAVETEIVREITHYIPATKRALADAGQLRTIIDSELREGVLERLDGQLLNGDGVGENLTGMFNATGINSVARDDVAEEPDVEAIHRAITAVELQFYGVSAVLMHPSDWEKIRLAKDGNDNYYYGPPAVQGPLTLWGVPVVKSAAVTEGSALLGDFRRAATLFVRAGIAIGATDSHDDWFIRRLVAVMATFRAAFAVPRPKALAEVTNLS